MKIKKDSDTDFVSIKSGSTFELNRGDTAIAMHSDGFPFFILAPRDEKSTVVLANGNLQSLMQDQMSGTINRSVAEIVNGLRKSESLMAKKDYTQAMTVLSSLKSKYSQVASIYFLSGSISYLLNNKSLAIDDLQKGLALDPNDQTAKNLLDKLKGAQ